LGIFLNRALGRGDRPLATVSYQAIKAALLNPDWSFNVSAINPSLIPQGVDWIGRGSFDGLVADG
jgi:hypothetical protein